MGDGGKYRYRRYSEFSIFFNTKTIQPLPHVAYYQSKENNYLNGGIHRMYAPIENHIKQDPILQHIMLSCTEIIDELKPDEEWFIQFFQNRVIAMQDKKGKPTPEGVHRDGVDFVLTLMINYKNINGGASFIYANDEKTLKANVLLKQPGSFILLNDTFMKHSVDPIISLNDNFSYRDVLIAMFTKRFSKK